MNVGQMIEESDTKSILAFMLTGAIIAYTFVNKQVPETLGTLGGLAVGYYFGKE